MANKDDIRDSEFLHKKLWEWQHSAYKFITEVIGVKLTSQQKDACDRTSEIVVAKIKFNKGLQCSKKETELAQKLGISIMSGRGTGKDFITACLTLWFLCCFDSPRILTTAITKAQLMGVLWAEISKIFRLAAKHNDGDSFLDRYLVKQATKIYKAGDPHKGADCHIEARPYAKNDDPEAQGEVLSGKHADFMMIVIDEASGIHPAVFNPLEKTMTGLCNFAFIIFNPTRSSGYAVDTHYTDKDNWVTLRWDARDSENVNKTIIENIKTRYGEDSDAWRVNVLGLPPMSDSDSVIPRDWVEDCFENDPVIDEDDVTSIGADIAGAGKDKSAMVRRIGYCIKEVLTNESKNTMETAGWINNYIILEEPDAVFIDYIGVGQGVCDRVKEVNRRGVHGIVVSNKSGTPERFYSLRDELWWGVRELFEKRRITIDPSVPRHIKDQLINELTVIKYSTATGKVKVESKRELRARGISSPDLADALCLSFASKENLLRKKRADMRVERYLAQKNERIDWMSV